MQISISARHGHLGEATQEKIAAKVEKVVRYFERLTAIGVTVNLENPEMPQVDIQVSAEHKHDFVATETSPSLMSAVDGAVQKIEQQLRKYKERVQERHRNSGVRRGEVPSEPEAES